MTPSNGRRCNHQWEPLVTIDPAGMTKDEAFAVAFMLGLQHLDSYDRCSLCGRISWLTRSRFRRRKLVSRDTSNLLQRAKQFEQSVAKQKGAVHA
jgi:hypothetical protein